MEFLLEITTEEMPLSHVNAALGQLEKGISEELFNLQLTNDEGKIGCLDTYGTCRRLIVHGDFVFGQKDQKELVIGPPRSAAYDNAGSPRPAALGFAKSQGISVKDLEVIKNERGEYVAVRKTRTGRKTDEILSEILPRLLLRLSFPKMMRWGATSFKFSRPVKRILALCDGRRLPLTVFGIPSVDFTEGHKLFHPEKFKVRDFAQYREELKKQKVIISTQERKDRIRQLILKKLEPFEANYYPDDDLLNKLAMDVEFPYVFLGTFPEKYLKLPIEVLSTAMREGQHLFSVVKGRKQMPLFVGVSDGCSDTKGLVRKGNERVLKARLEDARFFWEHDTEVPIKEKAPGLEGIIFQEKLGSYKDKAERVKKSAGYFSAKLDDGINKRWVCQAADLCKVDLLSDLVREFPSLQGKAGGLFARKEGYPLGVWKGIYEHYQPNHILEPIPTSPEGAILSICDKLDSIVGVMGIGVEISGSKDPFGLRRNAQGICTVILEKKLNFSFPRLLEKSIRAYGDLLEVDRKKLIEICLEFFAGRLEYLFNRMGYRYDLINAVLESGIENIYFSHLRLKALDQLIKSPQFEAFILIAKRVNNILRGQPRYRINSNLFREKEERELYTTFCIIRDNVLPLIAKGDFIKSQRIILKIKTVIHQFFDRVLVMDEDLKMRRNRLAMLQEISLLFGSIADYSQIVVEG